MIEEGFPPALAIFRVRAGPGKKDEGQQAQGKRRELGLADPESRKSSSCGSKGYNQLENTKKTFPAPPYPLDNHALADQHRGCKGIFPHKMACSIEEESEKRDRRYGPQSPPRPLQASLRRRIDKSRMRADGEFPEEITGLNQSNTAEQGNQRLGRKIGKAGDTATGNGQVTEYFSRQNPS